MDVSFAAWEKKRLAGLLHGHGKKRWNFWKLNSLTVVCLDDHPNKGTR